MDSLLVAVLVVLTVSGVRGDHVTNEREEHDICEGSSRLLDCSDFLIDNYIEIVTASYGRHDLTTCVNAGDDTTGWNDNCDADVAYAVQLQCGGKMSCNVNANNSLLDPLGQSDSCLITPKYLDITYSCVEKHIPCKDLPDRCFKCCHLSPCSKTCGHGVAQAIFFCNRPWETFFEFSLCTVECCIEPCPGNGLIPSNGGHCFEHYPHVDMECNLGGLPF